MNVDKNAEKPMTLSTIELPDYMSFYTPFSEFYPPDKEVKTVTMPAKEFLILHERAYMTDEKFIEWLKKVKEYCRSEAFNNCKECNFFVDRYLDDRGRECGHCQFSWIASKLTRDPADWNIKELERIIKL